MGLKEVILQVFLKDFFYVCVCLWHLKGHYALTIGFKVSALDFRDFTNIMHSSNFPPRETVMHFTTNLDILDQALMEASQMTANVLLTS